MAKSKPNILADALRMGATPLLFAGVFSLISNFLYLGLPIYTNLVYSRVLASQSSATLIVLTIGVVFVFVISTIMDVLRQQVLIDFGAVFDRVVSGRVFAALFDAVARRKSSPRSQALRDLDQYRNLLTGQTVSILFDVPWIPIFLIALFFVHWIIGLIALASSILLLILTWMQDVATRHAYESGQDQSINSYAFTDAALRNSEVIRALGMMQTLGGKWAASRNDSQERYALANERANTYSNIIKMVRLVVQILMIAVGAWLITEQKIPAGMLFANMIISARALQPIDRLVGSWNSLVSGKQAYDRLVSLLEGYDPPPTSTELPRPTGHLSVNGLGFAMPGAPRLLLSNVNFELQAGETLGVVGPSGAGKSTLARMLMGVWIPFSGHIRLDGAEVHSFDRTQFGRAVGYLPQDVELFAGSVRENIARFRSDATDAEVIEAGQLANAHEFILGLPKGYDTEVGEGGAVLSAGQRQRVGLARALFGSPAFVVLDEPNAALDTAGEEALIAALQSLKQRGVTVVIVSHKASIFRSADKILLLQEGRTEAFGPRDAVFAHLQRKAIPQQAAPQNRPGPGAQPGGPAGQPSQGAGAV